MNSLGTHHSEAREAPPSIWSMPPTKQISHMFFWQHHLGISRRRKYRWQTQENEAHVARTILSETARRTAWSCRWPHRTRAIHSIGPWKFFLGRGSSHKRPPVANPFTRRPVEPPLSLPASESCLSPSTTSLALLHGSLALPSTPKRRRRLRCPATSWTSRRPKASMTTHSPSPATSYRRSRRGSRPRCPSLRVLSRGSGFGTTRTAWCV